MAERKEFFIRTAGQLVAVTKEVYYAHHQMRRREKYLEERDEEHGKFNYHAFDTDEYGGEEIIKDTSCDVENQVLDSIMVDKLRSCLPLLTDDERVLVDELYYKRKSLRYFSQESAIPLTTLHDRHHKLLAKLKKLLEN